MRKIIVGLTFLSLTSFITWSLLVDSNDYSETEDIVRSIASSRKKSVKLDSEITKKIRTVKHLSTCFESKDCGFSKNDSREYDLELGQALKREIEDLYEEVSDREIESESISALGRKYLKSSDGHIKEAALMLLSTQPPSSENLDSILEDAISFHSAPLAELAVVELSKYQSDSWRESIDETFLQNLKSGSLIVRQTLAKNIGNFLTDYNRDIYLNFAQNESTDSRVRKLIMASLNY